MKKNLLSELKHIQQVIECYILLASLKEAPSSFLLALKVMKPAIESGHGRNWKLTFTSLVKAEIICDVEKFLRQDTAKRQEQFLSLCREYAGLQGAEHSMAGKVALHKVYVAFMDLSQYRWLNPEELNNKVEDAVLEGFH